MNATIDWSQAPEWATHWAAGPLNGYSWRHQGLRGMWLGEHWSYEGTARGWCRADSEDAPLFGFDGEPEDSLVKRP